MQVPTPNSKRKSIGNLEGPQSAKKLKESPKANGTPAKRLTPGKAKAVTPGKQTPQVKKLKGVAALNSSKPPSPQKAKENEGKESRKPKRTRDRLRLTALKTQAQAGDADARNKLQEMLKALESATEITKTKKKKIAAIKGILGLKKPADENVVKKNKQKQVKAQQKVKEEPKGQNQVQKTKQKGQAKVKPEPKEEKQKQQTVKKLAQKLKAFKAEEESDDEDEEEESDDEEEVSGEVEEESSSGEEEEGEEASGDEVEGEETSSEEEGEEASSEAVEGGEASDDNDDDDEDSNEEEEASEEEKPATKPKPAQKGGEQNSSNCTVFVGNLPYSATKDQLQEHFKKAGEIVNVRIPEDQNTGKPRGFAYIEFKNAAAFEKALNLNQTTIDGRKINVNSADKKPQNNRFQGNQGSFRGNQGGFRGNRGGFRGSRGGGFRGNQGGFRGNRGGGFKGNQQRPQHKRQFE